MLNAILYLGRCGIGWGYLPREYSAWQAAYGYFRRWSLEGVL